MPFILTRINVGDYDAWKPMFDSDGPGARKSAKGYRVLRGVADRGQVAILIEYDTLEQAAAAREMLLASGVLDRFDDKTLPELFELADARGY